MQYFISNKGNNIFSFYLKLISIFISCYLCFKEGFFSSFFLIVFFSLFISILINMTKSFCNLKNSWQLFFTILSFFCILYMFFYLYDSVTLTSVSCGNGCIETYQKGYYVLNPNNDDIFKFN